MLKPGLYEQVINKLLASKLAHTDKLSKTAPIDAAESAKVLSKYIAKFSTCRRNPHRQALFYVIQYAFRLKTLCKIVISV